MIEKRQGNNIYLKALLFMLPALAIGCAMSNDDASMDRSEAGYGADTDGGYASDGDTDVDTDTDADSDADTGGTWYPPEEEKAADYRVPQSSGRYVFVADAAHNAVVVVDSETLEVNSVDVGAHPTHLVPLGDANAVAVLNLDSDSATLIRIDEQGAVSTVDLEVRPGTNALRVTDDGSFVVAFFDPLFLEESGVPATDQEITVIRTSPGQEEAFHKTVGMHPRDIRFNDAMTQAFVITEEGISVVDLMNAAEGGLPPIFELFNSLDVDPDDVEYAINPEGTLAVGRAEGSTDVVFAYLDELAVPVTYALGAAPTDLDIAPDGTWGMFVLRSTNEVAFFDLTTLPTIPPVESLTYESLGSAICGVATIAPSGEHILLHTTTAGDADDRKKLTLMSRDLGTWAVRTVLTEREIASVIAGVDSTSGIVLHEPVTPSSTVQPHSYTMLSVPGLQKKFQQIPVDPTQILLTPNGNNAFMLLGDSSGSVRQVDVLDLSSFIVDGIALGSVPQAAGYAPTTDKVFVAQDHPAGRMTFIGVEDESIKTVTGYQLNNDISD